MIGVGGVRASEKLPQECAAREILEETGLKVKPGRYYYFSRIQFDLTGTLMFSR